MSLKIFLTAGLLISSITGVKYTNESWKFVDDLYRHCGEVVRDFPTSTSHITGNMMESFKVFTLLLGDLANYENSTITSNSAVMMLKTLALLEPLKDSPENMLIQFNKVLPKMSAGLRQIVSTQRCSLGKLIDDINNDIGCIERSVKRLLTDFVNNGVRNLALGRKADFEPVVQCLQKLTNKIGQISETTLSDNSLSTDSVHEAITIMAVLLNHCFVFIQAVNSTIAAIVHSKKKRIPATLTSILDSVNDTIVHLTTSIRSVTDLTTATLLTLLQGLVSLNDFLNAIFKSVVGLTTGAILTAKKITEGLSCGISSATQGPNILG